MNPTSKRTLLTLGSLVCLAIILLGLTEYLLKNGTLSPEATKQAVTGTMLKTTAVAFPLLLVAIYILDRQEKVQVKALRESIARSTKEERTRSQNILEGTEAGTWDWNLQTSELILNERWAEIVGYTLKELEPIDLLTWEKSVHPEDLKKAQIRIEQHLSGVLEYYDIEFRQRHKSGDWKWVNARGKITEWTEDGVPLRMSGTHLDITKRKKAEEANTAARQLLQNVFDAASGVSVIATDQNGIITLFNSGAECMLGYSADEIIGKTTPSAFHLTSELKARGVELEDVTKKAPIEYMNKVLAAGKEHSEWTYRHKDGKLLPVKLSLTTTHNAGGEINGYLGVAMDISTIKQAQKDLIIAKEEAEAASHAKDEFLAVMSHEMRTPLNPILGFSDMLQQSITTEPEVEYIETIINAANRQLCLIDDILEYMRINSGTIAPSPEPLNLTDLCELAVADAQAFSAPLKLNFEPPQEHSPDDFTVESDLMMLRRILDNLISNACKYTHEGSITVSLKRSLSEDGIFIIAVEDTGIGIDSQSQQLLFDAFSQADSSYTRKHEGLGLGLAICKKLLTILGGKIEVESTVGVGSTFTVHLPLKELKEELVARSQPAKPHTSQIFTRPCNVLIVDDQSDNRLIARTLIESFGGRATEATNGKEAVELCREQSFDLILMDLAMPVMHGKEAAAQIRDTENMNQTTPIIAVTADVTPKVQDACSAAGMQHYISKPIDSKELFARINEHI